MITRNEQLALVGAALVVGVLLWQGGIKSHEPEVMGAVEGVTWKAGYPEGHEHLALPWDIGSVAWGPHPLYCGPNHPGQYRDRLIAEGWSDWISDPPSEATI
jgi:hypothetical protein